MNIKVEVFGKNPFNVNIEGAIQAALDATADDAKKHFLSHGKHYTGGIDIDVTSERFARTVSTDDERVYYVDQGAKPHEIVARDAPSLAFKDGPYVSKTSVHIIPSHRGGETGNYVYPVAVMHPGFAPREIGKAVADETREEFIELCRRAIVH